MDPLADGVDPVAALRALGVPEATARAAVEHDRIALALVSVLLDVPRPHTLASVAERSGVPPSVLRERYHALGIPEAQRLSDGEVHEAELLAELLQIIPPDILVRVLRVDGQALTRVALAHLDLVYEAVVDPIREAGGGDVAVALALVEAYRALRPVAAELLRHSYDRVIAQLLTTELVAEATRSSHDEVELSVGFADVVGYTSLSARIDPGGLEDVIEAFQTRCYHAADASEAQLVKFLGDAAMFVASEPAALAGVLLATVTRAEDGNPLAGSPIRAGMAHGPVLLHGGDYYGPTVNLAARLTDRARAFRVLAAGDLAEELSGFDLRRAPTLHLRGIGRHKPVSVRPPAATEDDE